MKRFIIPFVISIISILLNIALLIYCQLNNYETWRLLVLGICFALQILYFLFLYFRYKKFRFYESIANALQKLLDEEDPFEEYAENNNQSETIDENTKTSINMQND